MSGQTNCTQCVFIVVCIHSGCTPFHPMYEVVRTSSKCRWRIYRTSSKYHWGIYRTSSKCRWRIYRTSSKYRWSIYRTSSKRRGTLQVVPRGSYITRNRRSSPTVVWVSSFSVDILCIPSIRRNGINLFVIFVDCFHRYNMKPPAAFSEYKGSPVSNR